MEMDVRALNALIPVFDFVGIVAFALSGVFEGIKRRIDPVGVLSSLFRRLSAEVCSVTF